MTEASSPLGPVARSTLVLAGMLLLLLAWPVGFGAMVFSGGGHGSPFDGSVSEWIFGAAMVGIPLLMLMLGIACIVATSRRRLWAVWLLAAAIPADLAVAATAMHIASRPRPPKSYAISAAEADINRGPMIAGPPGRSIGIACSAMTDECVVSEAGAGTTANANASPGTPPDGRLAQPLP